MQDYMITRDSSDDSLEHFGIKGQKWGVRRFENADGTLTAEGKKRYNKYQTADGSMTEKGKKKYEKALKTAQGEKISKQQMVKNALKRGAVGAVVGSSVAQLGNRIAERKAFNDAVDRNPFANIDAYDSKAFDETFKDYSFKDFKEYAFASPTSWKNKGGSLVPANKRFFYPEYSIKSQGKALQLGKMMTSNLLTAPGRGALIGGGVTALGSLAVDSIHNLKIDKAKKFVAQYQAAYEKTYGEKMEG